MRSYTRALGALAVLTAAPAAAHETLYEVQGGSAIAVKVYHADGEALAHGVYQVYSPAEAKIPFQEGRTDRNGWLAFVPDAPGRWRVLVADDTGHGFAVEIDADPPAGEPVSRASAPGATSSAAFVLRPLVGVAVIAAVFAALFLAYRRKGRAP